MVNRLWGLIEDEAEAIVKYYDYIESLEFGAPENDEQQALLEVMRAIVAEEEDHIKALQYLFGQLGKAKPETDVQEKAKSIIATMRENRKLIK